MAIPSGSCWSHEFRLHPCGARHEPGRSWAFYGTRDETGLAGRLKLERNLWADALPAVGSQPGGLAFGPASLCPPPSRSSSGLQGSPSPRTWPQAAWRPGRATWGWQRWFRGGGWSRRLTPGLSCGPAGSLEYSCWALLTPGGGEGCSHMRVHSFLPEHTHVRPVSRRLASHSTNTPSPNHCEAVLPRPSLGCADTLGRAHTHQHAHRCTRTSMPTGARTRPQAYT